MKLSILIPTVTGREDQLHRLTDEIDRQKDGNPLIQVYIISDNKEISIGEKRNRLFANATGEYSVQIDDDDMISEFYIDRVLKAIEHKTDCIGYYESVVWDGEYLGNSSISLRHNDWADNKAGHRFVRTPFYKVPIRTEIAKQVPFKNLRWGEDYEWSKLVFPLLKTEVFIPDVMYLYSYIQGDHKTKYGFK